MQSAIKQRLIQYLKYKKISQKKFEQEVGLSNGYVNNISKGIGTEKISAICTAFPDLNRVWLLTGVGDMLGTSPPSELHTIRYYPEVEGTLGGVEFLTNPNEKYETITIPGYTDCTIAINAYGNSMQPTIKSGQVLLLAEWQERFIEWGKIYLVVTKNGYRCVKYLFPSDDETQVICRSEDKENYPDFRVSRGDISRMYLVKGWICRDAI